MKVLRPGNYTVVIHDPTNWKPADFPTLNCAPFQLSYLLLTGTNDVPVNYCDESETLPTDLSTLGGGSLGYGGPQSADGSIRFYGENFLIPKQPGAHDFIQFKVPQDNFFRIFSRTSSPKNDVDFYIYSNTSRNFQSLTNYTNASDSKESGLFLLKAQPNPFLLDISYFQVDLTQACNYFPLMIEMKPTSRVYGQLACPQLLPLSLTTDMTLSSDLQTSLHGTYVFTKGQVDRYTVNNKFRYRITLHVQDSSLIFADIAFDFLANDFHLTLTGADGQKLESGEMSAGEPGEDFSMHNTFTAALAPGIYYLDINEDLMKTDLRLTSTQCHRFGIFISSFSDRSPKVLLVSPDSETAHSSTDDLIIAIHFSDAVAYPSSDQLALLVNQNHWIQLKTDGADRPAPGHNTRGISSVVTLPPNSLSYSAGNTVLMAKWLASTLQPGKVIIISLSLSLSLSLSHANILRPTSLCSIFATLLPPRGRIIPMRFNWATSTKCSATLALDTDSSIPTSRTTKCASVSHRGQVMTVPRA